MKAEIISNTRPTLKAGQLWKEKNNGLVYLAVEAGPTDDITLIATSNFRYTWANNKGFNGDDLQFEYVGELKISV